MATSTSKRSAPLDYHTASSATPARTASLTNNSLSMPVITAADRIMPALIRLTAVYDPMTTMIAGLGTQR